MFVPKRKPGAHQVAASQGRFDGCHIYLESGSDCKFWRFFIDRNRVMLHACHGWPQVVETINKEQDRGITCIGIIDNDFRAIIDYPDTLPENVFTTDDHDIEMMVLKTESAMRVATHFDASGKIAVFEQEEGDLMEFVFGVTDIIGLVKLVNKKSLLNMTFKKIGKNETLELPNYEKFLDNNTCHFISEEKMIRYLSDWSTDQRKQPNKGVEEIQRMVESEKVNNYDTMQLSCGHDACYILAYVLKKRIANKSVTQEHVEELLSVSYTAESLRKTQLYQDLVEWSQNNGITILNC